MVALSPTTGRLAGEAQGAGHRFGYLLATIRRKFLFGFDVLLHLTVEGPHLPASSNAGANARGMLAQKFALAGPVTAVGLGLRV